MRALYLGIFAFLFGCSAGSTSNTFGSAGAGAAPAAGAGGTGRATGRSSSSGSGTGGEGGGIIDTDVGSGGAAPGVSEVFAHSAATLYKLDPDTKVVTTVGNFSNCDTAVIDIAL